MGEMKTVEHQIDKNRFILNESQSIDFSSTYVPFALRGQGYQIEASCWYVKKLL